MVNICEIEDIVKSELDELLKQVYLGDLNVVDSRTDRQNILDELLGIMYSVKVAVLTIMLKSSADINSPFSD